MPLFERIAGRTMLSDAGRVMVPYAERAVAAAQDAENAVRALAQPNSGPVALAVVGTLAGGRLSQILKRFAAEHPDVELDLAHRDQRRGQRPDPARRGDDRPALRSRPLARSRLRIAVHRAARRSCARRIIRAPAAASRDSPICAANAGSHFRWCRDAARSRRRMSSRCSRPTDWAKSPGRRSTA